MGRRGHRTTVERGIYRDAGGFEVVARVGQLARRRRFALDTDPEDLRKWRDAQVHALREGQGPTADPSTLAGAIERYITQVGCTDTAELGAFKSWIARHGSLPRRRLTPGLCVQAFEVWKQTFSPQACYYRRLVLRKLWHALDGPTASTPVDAITIKRPRAGRPVWVDDATILAVYASLVAARTPKPDHLRKTTRRKASTTKWDQKAPARFLVLATTGQRPAQLKRAQPEDVQLWPEALDGIAGIWWVRPAKGGERIPVYLNPEMAEAWRRFLAADAWGDYDARSFAKTIRRHGWPVGVRPYNTRHAVGLTLSESGADLADIQSHFGHTDSKTTRAFYVPQLHSRLKALSKKLAGRFTGLAAAPAAPLAPSKERKAVSTP